MKTFLKIGLALFAIAIMIFAPVAGAATLAFVPAVGNFNINEIERIAKDRLSSFNGFEGGYYGQNDDFLDFGGSQHNFMMLPSWERNYTLTIANTTAGQTAATLTALLCPGIMYVPGVALDGAPKTGAFDDAAGTAGLTGAGSPTTVEEFLAFIMHNPMQIHRIKISTNNAAQISQPLIVQPFSPFQVLASRTINPSILQNQDTQQDKIVVFDIPSLLFAKDQKVSYAVLANTTVTFTFFAGAVLNTSKTLEKRVTEATQTVATAIASGTALSGSTVPVEIASAAPTKRGR